MREPGDQRSRRLVVFCNDRDYFLAHRYDLVAPLVASGAAVRVYCGGMGRAARHGDLTIRPILCNRFAFRPLRDCLLFLQMVAILLCHRPRTVHTITLKPNLIGGLAVRLTNAVRRRPARLVALAPGLGRVFAESPGLPGDSRRRFVVGGLRRVMAPETTLAVFENDVDRQVWLEEDIGSPSRAVVVSGAGVDPTRFPPDIALPKPSPLRILFASRLLRSKGADFVLDLAHHFEGRETEVVFLVAGHSDPRDADRMVYEGRRLPSTLHYLGFRSDVAGLIAQAHAVLLPTRYAEGVPRILLEAASMSRPAITTDQPGCLRIAADGSTGFVLPVENGRIDREAAIAAVESLIAEPRRAERMGRAALRAFCRGGFDIVSVRRDFERMLSDDGISPKELPRLDESPLYDA